MGFGFEIGERCADSAYSDELHVGEYGGFLHQGVRGWMAGRHREGPSPRCGQSNNARHECGCQSWCLRVFRFWVVVRLTEHSAGRSPRMQGNLGEVEQRMWQAMYSSGSSAFLKKPIV